MNEKNKAVDKKDIQTLENKLTNHRESMKDIRDKKDKAIA